MGARPNVVVAIPVYRPHIAPSESFALRRCLRLLPREPVVLFGPEGMDLSAYTAIAPDARIERFPSDNFASRDDYSEMLLHPEFYRRFEPWEYMLLHQLDAMVFEDQLPYWCSRDYDYIGAPWFREFGHGGEWQMIGVGNGGFCLRKPAACLASLTTRQRESASDYWRRNFANSSVLTRAVNAPKRLLKSLGVAATVEHCLRDKPGEDIFFGLEAERFMPGFRVAPIDEAVYFAFEMGLEGIHERYRDRLPFGCHAVWNVNCAYEILELGLRPEGTYNGLFYEILMRVEAGAAPSTQGAHRA